MKNHAIDLRSDTLSMPTEEMLQSIQTTPLGDDSRDGDPTVMELEALAADLMGKEAGLLNPSGTMSNLVAMRTHSEPGATAIVEHSAHLYGAEIGGIAAACGLLVLPVPGHHGAMDLDRLTLAVRKIPSLFPTPGLLCLEDTHNAAGGTVIPPETLADACRIAREGKLAIHLDGARIFNASVALGVDPRELTEHVDSVCFCLSKGLSAPIGSVLTGSRKFIRRARLVRRAMGGTLRQAGIIAAPGLIALHSLIPRLEEDHENARVLAQGLDALKGLQVDMEAVQSNIVNLDVSGLGIDAATFMALLDPRGVRGLPGLESTVRFVTYRGITASHIQEALGIVRTMVTEAPWENPASDPTGSSH